MKAIDTARFSAQLRARSIDLASRRLLVTRLADSDQEQDLSVPANCQGFGRVRHFKQATSAGWPNNQLPIVPACFALKIPDVPVLMTAQVFQNAACNWRCWYCYVPFNLLSADESRSAWLQPKELVALYKSEPARPKVLDLSGGSPDLVPEWVPWMMEALVDADIAADTYLWSDDNLSTNYLFDELSKSQLNMIRRYPMYGRVGCFKGFDNDSFAFNTGASAADFDRQFEIMHKLLDLGIDMYAYVTMTTENVDGISDRMGRFVDRLQALDPNLPLRTIPLEIRMFSPVGSRMDDLRRRAIAHQDVAVAVWNQELTRRYTLALRQQPIAQVPLQSRRCL
jgi:uncharacterized Fe-S cluster-containing radical SAM superfamily protein